MNSRLLLDEHTADENTDTTLFLPFFDEKIQIVLWLIRRMCGTGPQQSGVIRYKPAWRQSRAAFLKPVLFDEWEWGVTLQI